MSTKKIYGPWIKWHGGARPVPRGQEVMVKLRSGKVQDRCFASHCRWNHFDSRGDIVEYRTVTEQSDLDAAEKLLRDNGYTTTPPTKPLTVEDVVPMTKAPPKGTPYWAVQPTGTNGVGRFIWTDDIFDENVLRHRMAYLDKEHALVAAQHIIGLLGGEL